MLIKQVALEKVDEVSLTARGGLTVSNDIRTALGWDSGTRLEVFRVEGGGLMLAAAGVFEESAATPPEQPRRRRAADPAPQPQPAPARRRSPLADAWGSARDVEAREYAGEAGRPLEQMLASFNPVPQPMREGITEPFPPEQMARARGREPEQEGHPSERRDWRAGDGGAGHALSGTGGRFQFVVDDRAQELAEARRREQPASQTPDWLRSVRQGIAEFNARIQEASARAAECSMGAISMEPLSTAVESLRYAQQDAAATEQALGSLREAVSRF